MRQKHEIRFSPNSSFESIRTLSQVYKFDISLIFNVAMVTKMAFKIGCKKEIDHFGANLRRLKALSHYDV